jgi:hypothetical protein
MADYNFDWMLADDPHERGSVSVRSVSPISALLSARRFVREKRFPGCDLSKIVLTPNERQADERRSEREIETHA